MEAAERALEMDPRNQAARFNLALALDRLGLHHQAVSAWEQLLSVDSTSGWAKEAERRVRELAALPIQPSPPSSDASFSGVAAYVKQAPQQALLLGWDNLLGQWGSAVLAGDTAHARTVLRLALWTGYALEQRGGDATLADAVRDIHRRSGDLAATQALARAHHAYAAARAAYLTAEYSAAEREFAQVLAAPDASLPLVQWATLFRGAALIYLRQIAQGEQLLRNVAEDVDEIRHPALAGRARWMVGATFQRHGHSEAAVSAYLEAAEHFARAGEREHEGAALSFAYETEHSLGDAAAAYSFLRQALQALRPHRQSVWLHDLLYVAGDASVAVGFPHTAMHIRDEAGRVALEIGQSKIPPVPQPSFRFGEETPFVEASPAVPPVEWRPNRARGWLGADLRLARAIGARRGDPASATLVLDSLIASFDVPNSPALLLPGLLARAEARIDAGRVQSAVADLAHAARLIDQQQALIKSMPARAMVLDAARTVFDRAVMLHVSAGRSAEALAYLEMGRASFAEDGPLPPGPAGERLRSPPKEVAVEYALIHDALLIWTVSDTVVRLVRRKVDREALIRRIERARMSLEHGVSEAAARSELAVLFDWLVRPIRADLGVEGTPLVLIADGEIAGVPFAALFDSVRGRYLVEDHALRFASSLRHALRPPLPHPRSAVALFVSDPAFDLRSHPGFLRLDGAAEEVRSIKPEYREATVLADLRATEDAVIAESGKAFLVHFAGHAVYDEEHSQSSYLMLAPGPRGRIGSLTAAEIERLDLRQVRLVVLSACETSRVQNGRSGGITGLTAAFLTAGAGGVIGSLWGVDDQSTRQLMIEFHRAYRVSNDGAAALRHAQLRLMRSSYAQFRSPAAWAAFRYAGGRAQTPMADRHESRPN